MSQTKTRPVEPAASAAPSGRRKLLPFVIAGALAVAGAAAAAWYLLGRPSDDRIALSGRLESYETDIGARVPGRVAQVTVREGDAVRRGQLLVRLDDAELRAQLAGAAARLAAARQNAQQAELQIGVLESQLSQAQLNVEQARGETSGRIAQAEANLEAARASLAQARAQQVQAAADLQLARLTVRRNRQLETEGAIAQQTLDQAETTASVAQATLRAREAAVAAAERQVRAAEGALTQAQAARFTPDIRSEQQQATRTQLAQARTQLAAARDEVKVAQANQRQLEAQLAYLNIDSPISGVVTARSVEPGAVVTTGKTLLSLLNLDTVYLRGYIPEGQIGKVRVGQRARVFLDSDPDKPFAARVGAIDPQASFTPESIYFREERVRQVFGVKILIDDPQGFAKPGMPADAEILLEQRR